MNRIDAILVGLARGGVFVFVLCFAIAIWTYPGGNAFDRSHPGYAVGDNYLCDAFRARAYDGRSNPIGAPIGQVGMIGLVVAAGTALLLAPRSFSESCPRLARFAWCVAAIAFAAMMAVPLTPAHEYGVLHFAAVGFAAVPSLLATCAGGYGLLRVVDDEGRWGRALRLATKVALVACTLHFGQYALQASGVVAENPWLPRVQKLVVTTVVVWIGLLTLFVEETHRRRPASPTRPSK